MEETVLSHAGAAEYWRQQYWAMQAATASLNMSVLNVSKDNARLERENKMLREENKDLLLKVGHDLYCARQENIKLKKEILEVKLINDRRSAQLRFEKQISEGLFAQIEKEQQKKEGKKCLFNK